MFIFLDFMAHVFFVVISVILKIIVRSIFAEYVKGLGITVRCVHHACEHKCDIESCNKDTGRIIINIIFIIIIIIDLESLVIGHGRRD